MEETKIQGSSEDQLLKLRHKAKNGGVIVVPDWSDPDLFFDIGFFTRENPRYVSLGQVNYTVPTIKRNLKSKNPNNAGPTIDELVDAYGYSAIRMAQSVAEERDASIVLLHSKREYSELDITASLYGMIR